MVRNERQRARSQERKVDRMVVQTHGGYAGKSLIEQMVDMLDDATRRYLDAESGSNVKALVRGEVRGLARAVSLFGQPYYGTVKQAEKYSVRRIREERDAQERGSEEEVAE